MNNYSIDVIIPVYNCEKYILDAIMSVEKQTIKPFRIIVVNDGSLDNTSKVVKNYKCSLPLDFIEKSNGGPNSARNVGIKRSTSRYLAFLDADDEWYENKLECQLEVFEKSPLNDLGVVYCGYIIIDENGIPKNDYDFYLLDTSIRGNVFENILEANKIASSASGVLIKKECFEKVGLFDENLRVGEDWDMWIRIAEHYQYDYINDPLVKIRRHSNCTQHNEYYVFFNEIVFFNKWVKMLNKRVHCQKMWANSICSKIINHLPQLDYLHTAEQNLTKQAKQRLFGVMFGSLRLYLIGIISKRIIRSTFKIIRTFLREIIQYVKLSIMIIIKRFNNE